MCVENRQDWQIEFREKSVSEKKARRSAVFAKTTARQGRRKALLSDGGRQAFRLRAGFFVQSLGKFLEAGNDLRPLGQDR